MLKIIIKPIVLTEDRSAVFPGSLIEQKSSCR